ncbi:MAG: 2-oxoacid:acceptor oxidoreductase subunit alpha [Flavobacteriales bacterium]|nr:2-oxoacid:acceptor oxidoreductase subunit alpha [Flavobacteriales bacterium]MCW8912398.1 2-oxoacid:acceptor oxidoreductase subunit alpha [Flavobacteriales bacterium]MCW8936482.1 2-oxoacid:acceptor oxidoreductase subunit alpha [Flavobacteriales bacterium]MCW8940260.1 2-oxoacid:acceptor oxidoreductase subunit alpha [Flavobacteriales bacterium]MCW8967548.1 2-oxoacid:acceptor oxidoreductase subunit alpha [Flavobacteriales bacterium]
MTKNIEELEEVVIKFAGDSGDGMQLTGSQFSNTTAFIGNDLSTFPDFPAEIRAPQGTVAGVSGFKIQFGSTSVFSPGDEADVLVAMNPAALKANLTSIKDRGTIIIDSDSFKIKDFEKAQFTSNPLEDGTLDGYNLIQAPITSLTKESVSEFDIENKSRTRSKNMFALGVVYWLFNRPLNITENFLDAKFSKQPELAKANKAALKAGYNFAITVELLPSNYTIKPATLPKGKYRSITGNIATAWGLLAAAEATRLKLFLGTYPITPASDILHELSKYKNFDVISFQAEDEIAGICSAIGASFAGNLAVTSTSGPGLALKGEAIGLAMMTELPIVIIDVQRGGPSTGLPTKTEQSDLMQAVYGRNGESPVIVIAASTPSNCFDFAYQAAKLALEHMTPVILLTDGFIANGAEPWKIKSLADMPSIKLNMATKKEGWSPYLRDEKKLARQWAIPGTKELEHRIGGLEKQDVSGNVSYEPENHEKMVTLRADKVKRVANFIPELSVQGASEGDLLIVGWGGTYGSILTAFSELTKEYKNVGFAHFNYINPLPKNTSIVFSKYKTILVCELNSGQFIRLLKGELSQFNYQQYNKVQGLPFSKKELINEFTKYLK